MRFKIIAIILLAFISFSGCKKKKEVQIVGTWIEIPPTVQPDTYQYKWIFTEDNVLEIQSYETTLATTEYSLSFKFPSFYLDIVQADVDFGGFGGRYRIDDLDDEMLAITRIENQDGSDQGAFWRFEFIRE